MSLNVNRATWIWKTGDIISDEGQTDQFVAFAQRNRINRVHVHINPDLPHQDLAAFIGKCNSSTIPGGIVVEALMGDAGWIQNPHHQSVTTRLRWVEEYQRVYAHLPIRGLHLDIEPWQLPTWHGADQPEHIRQWVGCLQGFKSWAAAQQPPLPVAADLPFWLHTLQYPGTTDRLDVVMMTVLDGATFMTYRNTPQVLMDVAGAALEAGWRCRRRREGIYLAVECVPSEEGRHISYHGMGKQRLEADLGCLEGGHGLRMRKDHELWFGGLAVHDYHTWSAMEG
jgi:hypothetical protein